jgi:hypothetical protein
MNKTADYLEIHLNTDAFRHSAKRVITTSLNTKLINHLTVLKSINQKLGDKSFKISGNNLIPDIFKKSKNLLLENPNSLSKLDRRELRVLSFALNYSENKHHSIFSNQVELKSVLHAFDNNWRDSYLIGLFDCYLKNWESKNETKDILGTYILNKLDNYFGNRSVLKSLKLNRKYFNYNNGDVILGAEIALKNVLVSQSAKYLNLPDHYITYPYFCKVILSFYEKKRNNISQYLDEITNSLVLHNNGTTNKRIISKLIIQANSAEFVSMQESIKSMAFKFIGDPSISSNWLPNENATEGDINELKIAKVYLNEWITRQFINVFFEKCINDPRRKAFWLKYAKEISQFRIVGSIAIRRILMTDQRISEYVSPRFSKTNSANDRNAALMFIMKNHLFIEFSDEGAFYAYKLSNPNAPSIEEPYFFSTSNLKTTSMPWLAYRNGWNIYSMSEEGRLGHYHGWEDVAAHWLNYKAGIYV